jgi:hypothetical protein
VNDINGKGTTPNPKGIHHVSPFFGIFQSSALGAMFDQRFFGLQKQTASQGKRE